MAVRTLSSHGIFVWLASHRSKILLKVVACVEYCVFYFAFVLNVACDSSADVTFDFFMF